MKPIKKTLLHVLQVLAIIFGFQGISLTPLYAVTFTVTKTADTADGACDADCSLREAVIAANASGGSDTINLPAGTYSLSLTGAGEDLSATGDLDVTGDLTINGAANQTLINGLLLDRVFHVGPTGTNPALTLSGLSIQHGNSATPGGGIFSQSNNVLTLNDCNLEDNQGVGGGGLAIIAAGALLNLSNTHLINNSAGASAGGGILMIGGSNITITGGSLQNNKAAVGGGGMYVSLTGELNLTNTTVSNNNAIAGPGGGILETAGTNVNITSSSFTNNQGSAGGGILAVVTGELNVIDSTFESNDTISGPGGGIFDSGGTNLNLTRSRLVNNTAVGGGALFAAISGDLSIVDSALDSNDAGASLGGGILQSSGTNVTITGSSLSHNITTASGGALMTAATGSIVVTNSTLSSNGAGAVGGGILKTGGGAATLTNITIYENSTPAGATGAGIFNAAGTMSLKNSVISNSFSGNNCSGGGISSAGNNIENGSSCGFAAAGDQNADPLLGPLANNGGLTLTHNPLAGSPVIDQGTNVGCPGTDQRGITRPLDGNDDGSSTCDIGAVEFNRCGDGITQTSLGEACDDGNSDNSDACLNTCAAASCGDGFVETGAESCDDGNLTNGDGCSDSCQVEPSAGTAPAPGGGGCSLQKSPPFSKALMWGMLAVVAILAKLRLQPKPQAKRSGPNLL